MPVSKLFSASILLFAGIGAAAPALGQSAANLCASPAKELRFKGRKDSLDWSEARKLATASTGFRVIVSLQECHLWVVSEEDTLLSVPVSVATGNRLSYAGHEFRFDTPRGMRKVIGKDADPIWNPPNWLYVETAREHGLKIAFIPTPPRTISTSTGIQLAVQNNRVVTIDSIGPSDFPADLHIIYGETLYVPPLGTDNRRVNGTLGKYKLSLGDGYMLHGTPHQSSIGLAATHGCVRLRDEDIEWLFENVPLGTRVYIY